MAITHRALKRRGSGVSPTGMAFTWSRVAVIGTPSFLVRKFVPSCIIGVLVPNTTIRSGRSVCQRRRRKLGCPGDGHDGDEGAERHQRADARRNRMQIL